MNYREFKIKSANRNPGALWLGELDVFKVMASLNPTACDGEVSADRVLSLWAEKSDWSRGDEASIITTGVRDGLRELWNVLRVKVERIWVPSDVYPVYRELIPEARTYEIMGGRWSDIFERAGKRTAILLPIPLHPIGRYLTTNEESLLIEWLERNPQAWLIVDTAYDYKGWSFDHERCVILRTMSKSWLCRRMFGVLEGRIDLVRAMKKFTHSKDQLKYCYGALEGANIPEIQQELFAKAWLKIRNLLSDFTIDFDIPSTGYLAVIDAEKPEIISIPATVFGSDTSKRIISCLGEIEW